MVKGKAGNSKQEAMGPPMTRKSRRRGYPVEKMTEDDHQDLGEVNAEDTLVQYLQFPEEKSNKKCIEPLESSSIFDGNTNEKNEASETLEMTTVGLKTQSVILLSDFENESNQNKIDEQEQVPNKSESLNSSHKYIDVNDGLKPCSEEQMSAEDNHPKMKTNQELDEVKQISTEPEVIGTAKKRRRMGMCRASEKELRLYLPKCGNRAEKSEKQNKNTLVAEEEKGTSVKVLSPQQQATEMMQHLKAESSQNIEDDREENKVETAATGITTVCEPLSTEMHVSEDDPKGAHSEVFIKHRTQEEKGLQRTESGCCPDEAAPKCESSLSVYKSENAKSMGYHHCPEGKPTGEKMKCQETVLDNPCKDDTELDLIQASDQRPDTELQQNKAETETHLTVPDAWLPNLENWETAQKAHLDKEQQFNSSETEVNWTAFLSNIADSACERQTTKDHLEPDQTALLNEKKQMNEGEPQKEAVATFTEIHSRESKCSDGDSENCNVKIKINLTETPMEQDPLHQQDMNERTSLENRPQGIGDNPHLIHTSLSDSVLETNCSSREHSHMMNSNCEEKKLHDTDSTLNMRPSESREDVSDSQLNTIDITDQLTDDGIGVSSECYEDVTDLVGGLVRELSSLNRAVMATHRELENLRRKGKNSRNASR